MSDENLIYVHPAITWQTIDSDKLQIRVPDGQHITLTESAVLAGAMLERLIEPQNFEQIQDWAQQKQIGNEELETALATLHEYSIIVESRAKQNQGVFNNVLNFNVNSSKSIRSGLPFPYFSTIEAKGTGYIFNCVEQVIEQTQPVLDELQNESQTEGQHLRIVCSDIADQQYLLEQNRQAVKDKIACLTVQWTDEFLSIGPLYIPEESACYECLNVRKRAASNFLSELDAVLKRNTQRSVDVKLDSTLEYLISYAVSRYLSLVTRGMFHLVKPNEVETWDILKAEKTVGEVLRVPRCDACGRKKSSDPTRAIRDLNS
ncbi:TOMM precursor leader peptide-binding protein [Thalassotalea fusca]